MKEVGGMVASKGKMQCLAQHADYLPHESGRPKIVPNLNMENHQAESDAKICTTYCPA